MSKKTLTARDVISAGGAVTDELLEPFVSGNSEEERKDSQRKLREAVAGAMSFFSRQTPDVKEKEFDVPIISIGEESQERSTRKSTTSRTRKGRKK